MTNGASEVIVGFVLTRLATEPLPERAKMYRALAQFSPRNDERKQFEALAADCDAIQATHDQLVFDFRRRSRG